MNNLIIKILLIVNIFLIIFIYSFLDKLFTWNFNRELEECKKRSV
jgi:hypothetical protein